MNYPTRIYWAFVSAFLVSICWATGDALLVGFEPTPDKYPLFSVDYAHKIEVENAVHMLEGSTHRLMFGALLGGLTAPLLLPAMWLVYQFFRDKENLFSWFTYLLLLAGAMLSPLAHASFFYVGEICKLILHTNKNAHFPILETANSFIKMLDICWFLAIGTLFLGWIGVLILIARQKTHLPRWVALVTPIPMSIFVLVIKSFLPLPYSAWVGGAVFNIAYFLFFMICFVVFQRRKQNLFGG